MDASRATEFPRTKNPTTVKRKSDRELVVTRTVNAPARLVFEAWTKTELFLQWWIPKLLGITVVSAEADVRTGGHYRFVFKHGEAPPMAFFGRYLEVTPPSRIVWTNDEAGDAGAVTTLTLEEVGGTTLIGLHDLFPSKEALEAALASGEKDGMTETFDQLEALLGTTATAS